MLAVLTLIAVTVVAWLGAHVLLVRVQQRWAITTGGEYLLIGVLVGPAFSGLIGLPDLTLITSEVLSDLAPLMALAIGWLGLLYGTQLNVRKALQNSEGRWDLRPFQLAAVESTFSFLLVGAVSWAALTHLGLPGTADLRQADVMLASAVLGVVASVGSTQVLAVVKDRFRASGPTTSLLDHAHRFEEPVSVAAFGLIFCVFNPSNPALTRDPVALEWLAFSVGIGAALGVLFRVFLGDETESDKVFLALVGIIVFASGVAYYLHLSPLLVNLVLGLVLVNVATPDIAEGIRDVLARTRRPMFLMLLIFAGLLWTPVLWHVWFCAAAYVAVRLAGKRLGGQLASKLMGPGSRTDLGRGLLGHGDLAVAMALNFRLVPEWPLSDLVFTTILVSVVVSELWATRSLRQLLIDTGDIRDDGRERGLA
jgi:Kef-type K+ transport system membrane component KefB